MKTQHFKWPAGVLILAMCGMAYAQRADVIENQRIYSLPGLVLGQELGMNRQMLGTLDRLYFEDAWLLEQPVILYRNTQGNPTDANGFIREVWYAPRTPGNLP